MNRIDHKTSSKGKNIRTYSNKVSCAIMHYQSYALNLKLSHMSWKIFSRCVQWPGQHYMYTYNVPYSAEMQKFFFSFKFLFPQFPPKLFFKNPYWMAHTPHSDTRALYFHTVRTSKNEVAQFHVFFFLWWSWFRIAPSYCFS